jgi:hypothetical protein
MLLPGVNCCCCCCCSSIRELSKAASDAASNSSDYSNQWLLHFVNRFPVVFFRSSTPRLERSRRSEQSRAEQSSLAHGDALRCDSSTYSGSLPPRHRLSPSDPGGPATVFPSRSRAVQPCATSRYLDRAVSASPYIPVLGGYPDGQVRPTGSPSKNRTKTWSNFWNRSQKLDLGAQFLLVLGG